MKQAIRYLLVACSLFPAVLSAQTSAIIWTSFPVESEKFVEGQPGKYTTVGTFDGIGMMYFSPERRKIEFKGLRQIDIRYLGQEPDDKYEFRHESFTIESVIPIGDRTYAFQAVNDGPFARTVTGKLRFSVERKVQEFEMNEHGQAINGVMNRYVLPISTNAKAMLKKYEEVFFGGNYVALELEQ